MKLRGQTIIETDTHLVVSLKQPYWGAHKKYGFVRGGFTSGEEGYGISWEVVTEALARKKKILIRVFKYGNYEISAAKAIEFKDNIFIARDNKPLIVVPRSALTKIEKPSIAK